MTPRKRCMQIEIAMGPVHWEQWPCAFEACRVQRADEQSVELAKGCRNGNCKGNMSSITNFPCYPCTWQPACQVVPHHAQERRECYN